MSILYHTYPIKHFVSEIRSQEKKRAKIRVFTNIPLNCQLFSNIEQFRGKNVQELTFSKLFLNDRVTYFNLYHTFFYR